jgi:hypothetical protein
LVTWPRTDSGERKVAPFPMHSRQMVAHRVYHWRYSTSETVLAEASENAGLWKTWSRSWKHSQPRTNTWREFNLASYKVDGKHFYDSHNSRIGSSDVKNLYDSHNSKIGSFDAKNIYDSHNSRVGSLDGMNIYDSHNSRIGTMDDVRKAIAGPGGMTLVAFWVLMLR